MNKILLSFLLISLINIVLPSNYTYNSANAGLVTWGVKKILGGTVKLIFSTASDKIIEFQKKKLLQYLQKHPEHIEYAKNLIIKQINKHPKYKSRGYEILNILENKANNIIYMKN